MIEKKLIIDDCNHCPWFDNHYFSYEERCVKLNRRIEKDTDAENLGMYPIPEDCPLPNEEEAK